MIEMMFREPDISLRMILEGVRMYTQQLEKNLMHFEAICRLLV
jgi:hypothetical protein